MLISTLHTNKSEHTNIWYGTGPQKTPCCFTSPWIRKVWDPVP